ncbi:MAG: hypothetical protein ACRDK9_10335 [Solirubrobacterales bacterium]
MKLRTPSHTTVVAYLALFAALATGGAYAADKIKSADIANNTIKSKDLKNRKAVKGKDVKRDSLGGAAIRESSLDLPAPGAAGGTEAVDCDPTSETVIDCAVMTIEIPRPSPILGIGTGGAYSENGSARAGCEVRIDDVPQSLEISPGEEVDETNSGASNGFARTHVSQILPAGAHKVALACRQLDGDVRIDSPTIAAIAIG